MTTCPNCGCQFISDESAAAKVLKAVGPGDSNISWIKSQMLTDMANKEIYNALAYLTRKKMVQRISYGLYRKAER